LRELLVLIRDALDLPDDIVAKIDAALRSEVGRLEFFEYPPPALPAATIDRMAR
jgi:hypothetical protein